MDCFNNFESRDAHRGIAISVKRFRANKRECEERGRCRFATSGPSLVPGGNRMAISLTRLAREERNGASLRVQGSSH